MIATEYPVGHMLRLVKERAVVEIHDDRGVRSGHLVYWPNGRDGRRSPGGNARVRLASGTFVSVEPSSITVLKEH